MNTLDRLMMLIQRNGGFINSHAHFDRAYTAQTSDFERDRVLVSGQSCYIKKGDWHQIENPCKTPAKIIETWIGDYLDEDDIVRR